MVCPALRAVARALLASLLLWVGTLAAANVGVGEVALIGAHVEVTEGAVTIRHEGATLVYVDGLGWLADFVAQAPRLEDGVVWVASSVAAALGFVAAGTAAAAPGSATGRLLGVRLSGEVDVRLVLDLDGVGVETVRGVGTVGRVEADGVLRLGLPWLSLPDALPTTAGALDLRWRDGPNGPALELSGVAFSYDVFALGDPTRIVLDLRPDRDGAAVTGERFEVLAPGVVYRSFRAPGSGGPSRVHVVSVAPDAGEWRVVGAPGQARPTLRWADGGFVAINGGYFEPATRAVIGLLVVDGSWLSPPSRGRAVVGFGPDGVVIDRVQVLTGIWLDGRLVLALDHELAERASVHATVGSLAGSPSTGTLTLDEDDRVVDNRVGPVRVPDGGRVVVYPPELRAAALAESGTLVRTATRLVPDAFERVAYAVEAGPLLVQGGRDAFAPELEAFTRGVRILDEVTQQAAIGVMRDGTVLLVAAEAMVAADLVPLFLDLGAVDAMRLDSGGSTTLVADGRVLNRMTERAVVNAIVWLPAGVR